MCKIIKKDSEMYDYNEKSCRMEEGHTHVQWLFGILACTTVFTCGLQSGWVSPMTKLLQSDQSPTGAPLSDADLSWVGSALALTATCGVSLYAYIADAYGRKIGLIAIAVPQALCWGLKIFATNSTTLIIARVLAGIPSGGCFNLVPMYVKEISQDNIRGAMVSMTILMNNFGLLVMYVLGSCLDYYVLLYIVIVIPIVTSFLMVFAPESPAYLVRVGKYEVTARTTAMLRGLEVDSKSVQNEVQMMKNEEDHYRTLPKITFLNIFHNKAWRRGFLLTTLLIGCQGSSGTFTVMTYAWAILSSSGVAVSPELQSLVVPIVMIVGSIIAMFCVERVGRKVLLISTFALTAVAMLTLAVTQLLQSHGHLPPEWLPVAAMALSVWATSAGVTPMAYVIMSEIFSFQVRARLVGCLVTLAWLFCSIQVAVYPHVSAAVGSYLMFFIFAGVNFFGAGVSFFLPETRGKSLEQIERLLVGKN